jgi:hypothetical protein
MAKVEGRDSEMSIRFSLELEIYRGAVLWIPCDSCLSSILTLDNQKVEIANQGTFFGGVTFSK